MPNELQVTPMLQWAFQQGGITVVCLVVLFFYRRDWKTTVETWQQTHAITVSLVEKAISAQEKATAALAENTIVVHSLKRAIEVSYLGRRQADQLFTTDSKRINDQ